LSKAIAKWKDDLLGKKVIVVVMISHDNWYCIPLAEAFRNCSYRKDIVVADYRDVFRLGMIDVTYEAFHRMVRMVAAVIHDVLCHIDQNGVYVWQWSSRRMQIVKRERGWVMMV
jgi:hypothetical protein